MEWFRSLLVEKARTFQIVVFTCRPGDYLTSAAMIGGEGGAVYLDSEEGLVRAIALERAVGDAVQVARDKSALAWTAAASASCHLEDAKESPQGYLVKLSWDCEPKPVQPAGKATGGEFFTAFVY